jgi:hypothetical protein
MPEIPEIDNCCDKEPFAFFGLTAYYAQVLEEAALNLAVVLRLPEVNLISQELFLGLYDSLGRRTFGQLLKVAKSELSFLAPLWSSGTCLFIAIFESVQKTLFQK